MGESMSEESSPTPEAQGCLLPLWGIFLIEAILVGCAIFSIPVFNTLYGIVFPPSPPLPNSITETQKTALDRGVEETSYTTTLNPCQVIQFYVDVGGTCELLWEVCAGETYTSLNRSLSPMATCSGTTAAGVFGIRWEVDIAVLYPPDQTIFTISHEVLWGGMPLPTSTPSIPD
jgi:hypothetical protein